jgi:hypothetical protein
MTISTTIQPAAADTFILSATPTTNYGTNALIAIGDSSAAASAAYRILAKFDLSGIPANAKIITAALELNEYQAYDTAGTGSWTAALYAMLRDWVEAEATWNQYSSGNNWTTAGASGAGDIGSAVDGITLDGTAAVGFVTWNGAGLAALVQAWVEGSVSNYGVLIAAPTAEYKGVAPLSANLFRSNVYATSGDRPKLTVTYSMGLPLVNGGLVGGHLIGGNLA